MVFRYNSKEAAIDARQRIATAEGLPKCNNSDSIYFLDFEEINGSYYIDARGEESKGWYSIELGQADEVLNELPTVSESIGFSGYALIPTSETKELYPSLPYEIDANGLEVVQWDIVYENQYNYALAHLLTLVKTKYKPATLYPQNP